MTADPGFVGLVSRLDAEERRRLLALLTHEESHAAESDWSNWAHPGQIPPDRAWRTWVIMAGRGFGKTRAGAQWIRTSVAEAGDRLRIALVAATIDEARRVMIEGSSGLLEVAGEWVSEWHPSRRLLRFTTGAEATLFSGASPDGLRGPEHHLAWCDELAKWAKPGETWDMLQLGLRLGASPRALITTTPRPGPVLKGIIAQPGTIVTRGGTRANPHLAETYKRRVEALYAGTRLGRQELEGELLTDTPGALWTVELLEKCRFRPDEEDWVRPERSAQRPSTTAFGLRSGRTGMGVDRFARIVIGVDPPAGDGTCGIVACAKDGEGSAHVLADHSVTGRSPEGWARAVAGAAALHAATSLGTGGEVLVVAEQNQGGRMVEAVLRIADPMLRVKPVTATVGKAERAAPIAQLFEAGRVVLHGRFAELEAELLGMIAGGAYEGPGMSPDRADAMVWALTELMLGKERGEPRVTLL